MKLLKIALTCAFPALAIPAQAATVTLDLGRNDVADFGDTKLDNGDEASVGDFVLTFQNVRTRSDTQSSVSGSGIGMSSSFDNVITTVDLIFNIDTIIDSYNLGFTNTQGTIFQLSGPNGTSGLNSLQTRGISQFDMGSIPVFLAGESYALTHTVGGGKVAMLKSLQLSSPPPPPAVVPLPASLPLLLAAFGAVALLRRRT